MDIPSKQRNGSYICKKIGDENKKKIDPIEKPTEMAKMHDKYIKELDNAMNNEAYISVVWLRYSIFEQRTNRIIGKYIDNCPEGKSTTYLFNYHKIKMCKRGKWCRKFQFFIY